MNSRRTRSRSASRRRIESNSRASSATSSVPSESIGHVEVPGRDPARRALEPTQPARERVRRPVGSGGRRGERDEPGDHEARPHETHGRERIVERGGDEHDVLAARTAPRASA